MSERGDTDTTPVCVCLSVTLTGSDIRDVLVLVSSPAPCLEFHIKQICLPCPGPHCAVVADSWNMSGQDFHDAIWQRGTRSEHQDRDFLTHLKWSAARRRWESIFPLVL